MYICSKLLIPNEWNCGYVVSIRVTVLDAKTKWHGLANRLSSPHGAKWSVYLLSTFSFAFTKNSPKSFHLKSTYTYSQQQQMSCSQIVQLK